MSGYADPALLRWLMLPAGQADASHLPDRRGQDCARALRVASRSFLKPMHDLHALRSGDNADLLSWLRQDLASLRWGLYLAGAWVFGGKLRLRAGGPLMAALTRTLGAPPLLEALRSDDPYLGSLPALQDIDDVLAAGGALMYAYGRQCMPLLADRLLLRFPPEESDAWRKAPHVDDKDWLIRVAQRVLHARPEVAA
ncbi:hypothetical protein [Dyella mobilis]|uniref:Type III secretion protein n=1 Tax=Dyella mobilis TaxID=1849582 RepID=A0ABS2KC24_9GAMM|nr:hypothetical protein [Dyella mobilis]MBM7128494.1 hypothetical protein [Dyella mobilis]GLQ99605.1 hypothetical protein GCM10007863_40250 [Dyella mobilis]